MRPLFLAALAAPLLFAHHAEAASDTYTPKIKNIRIRQTTEGGTGSYRVVAVTTTDALEGVDPEATMTFAFDAFDGGPKLPEITASARDANIHDGCTFDFQGTGEFVMYMVVTSPTGIEQAVLFDELVDLSDGAQPTEWVTGQTKELELRYRIEPTGKGIAVKTSARRLDGSGRVDWYGKARVEVIDKKTGKAVATQYTTTETVRQRWVGKLGEGLDGFAYGYTASLFGEGSTLDITGGSIVFGEDSSFRTTIDRVVLTTDKLGHAKVVTRTSSPDTEAVVVESVVTDLATGKTLLALADESPVWLERHYQRAQIRFGTKDEVYTVGASATGFDAKGNAIVDGGTVKLSARSYTEDDVEIDGTTFADGYGTLHLYPTSEDGWGLFVRYAGDAADDVVSWQIAFDDDPKNPVTVPVSEVWRQFAARADAPLSDGGVAGLSIELSSADGEVLDASTALEQDGVAYKTGAGPDEIEIFLRGIVGEEGMRVQTMRSITPSRVRR